MGTTGGQLGGAAGAQLALSTGSLYNLSLDRAFALATACGYDGVELLVDGRRDTYEVPYLRTLMERWRAPILSVHSPFAWRVEGWPQAPEGRVERTVALAEELGAHMVICHAPLRWRVLGVHLNGTLGQVSIEVMLPWSNPSGRRYLEWLRKELPALEAASPVRVAVENMPARRVLGRRVAMCHGATLAEMAKWSSLVLDTTHWGTWGVDPVAAYVALKDRIKHVHLSDYDGREHRVPFRGDLRLEELLRALRAEGFEGVVVVELSPWAVARGDWGEGHLREVLGATAARLRGLLGRGASHSQTPGSHHSASARAAMGE